MFLCLHSRIPLLFFLFSFSSGKFTFHILCPTFFGSPGRLVPKVMDGRKKTMIEEKKRQKLSIFCFYIPRYRIFLPDSHIYFVAYPLTDSRPTSYIV